MLSARMLGLTMGLREAIQKLSEAGSNRQGINKLLHNRLFRLILSIGTGVLLVILLGGVPYVLFYDPPTLYRGSSTLEISFISPDRMGQGPIEAFYVIFMYALGIGGLLLIQYSSRRRSSQLGYLTAGILLLLISTLVLLWIGSQKPY